MTVLLRNGRFYTLCSENEAVDAVVVEAGKIAALGDERELAEQYPSARQLDLGGRAVTPGFTDSHLHLMSFGSCFTALNLAEVESIEELKKRVRSYAEGVDEGQWVVGRGWDQDRFKEARYPTRHDLDAAAPEVPVFLRRACGHAAVANTAALEAAGLDREASDPTGGKYDREPETGELTGLMRERAMQPVQEAVPEPTRAEKTAALEEAVKRAWEAGITAVHANDARGPEEFAELWELYGNRLGAGEGALPFRVYLDTGVEALEALKERELLTGAGDDYFRLGSIKIFADGSLGASTAALYEDYADESGNRGILMKPEEELIEDIISAHEAGMQVAVHAIGDRAAGITLEGIESALEKKPREDHRHRIIHCQILSEKLIERMAAVGVVADVQPKFVTTDMLWTEDRVGTERTRTSYAWKSLLEAGVPVAFGSDAPVEPIDPLLGIYAAVTRKNLEGAPEGGWYPEQRLSTYEAFRGFTLGGAYAEFAEEQRGTLEVGKQADLVAFDRDPFRVPADELKELEVKATIVGGNLVYSTL